MARTFIPKLLRLAQDMALYLTSNRHHMAVAGHLTDEQQQAHQETALHRVQTLLGPQFPQPTPPKRKADLWAIDVRVLHVAQQGRCYYCGATLFPHGVWPKSARIEGARRYHVEHARPLSRGGTDAPENLRLACEECNRHKGMLTEAEFRAALGARAEDASGAAQPGRATS